MMKYIGIIKFFLPLNFSSISQSNNGYNIETINFMRSFNNAVFHVLSANDISNRLRDENNVFIDSWSNPMTLEEICKFDKIFIFNSKFSCDRNDSNDTQRLVFAEVEKYKRMLRHVDKKKKVYVVTDLSLYDEEFANTCGLVISQSADSSFGEYVPIQMNYVLSNELKPVKFKHTKIIYVGNERDDRKDELISFATIFKKDMLFVGKYAGSSVIRTISNVEGPYKFNIAQRLLEDSMFTIVTSDSAYKKYNFLTPRYYEALQNNVIAFVRDDYDKIRELRKFATDKEFFDYRIFHTLEELQQKINFAYSDTEFYNKLLIAQRNEYEFACNNYKDIFTQRMIEVFEDFS